MTTIDFDAALEAYLKGDSHEELLRDRRQGHRQHLPIDPQHADTISKLTDHLDIEIETYCDAARAIRLWFFQNAGAGREALDPLNRRLLGLVLGAGTSDQDTAEVSSKE